MVNKNIEKIKKIFDNVYNFFVLLGFLALICCLPNEIADFFGLEFFRNQNMLMFIFFLFFFLLKYVVDNKYEDKKINEKYYDNTKE